MSHATKDERRVDAAERELVADHPGQLRAPRLALDVVERRAALIDVLWDSLDEEKIKEIEAKWAAGLETASAAA